jgi:hypothetical protein
MRNTGKEDEYENQVNPANCKPADNQCSNGDNAPCIRVSNERYAKDATFEERLSIEDKQMLRAMGVGL